MIFFGIIVLVFAVVGFAVATWDTSKAMFHNSEDVRVTIESVDYSLQEALDGGLIGGAGGGMTLGDWTTIGTLAAGGTETLTNDHTYVAQTDGFVIAYTPQVNHAEVYIYTGSDQSSVANKAASVLKQRVRDEWYRGVSHITIPIKKGDYWKIYSIYESGVIEPEGYYWLPIISGGSSGSSTCQIVRPYNPAEVAPDNLMESITVPSVCKDDNRCYIIFKSRNDVGNIIDIVAGFYSQDSSGIWFAEGDKNIWGTNGDATNTEPFDVTGCVIRDDSSGIETSANSWTYRDGDSRYACELIVCS